MGSARLSVVVTTHDSLDSLKLCLDSIIAGGWTLPEMVVYADGSPAETHDYLEKLMLLLRSRRRGVQLVFYGDVERVGRAGALNRAARMASGDWLYLVEDDMVFEPGFDSALLRHVGSGRVLSGTVSKRTPPSVGSLPAKAPEEGTGEQPESPPAAKTESMDRGVNYPCCVERTRYFEDDGADEQFSGPLHEVDLFYRWQIAGAEMLRVRDSLCQRVKAGRTQAGRTQGGRVNQAVDSIQAAELKFLKKWGELPHVGQGGTPNPGVKHPYPPLGILQQLNVGLRSKLLAAQGQTTSENAARK